MKFQHLYGEHDPAGSEQASRHRFVYNEVDGVKATIWIDKELFKKEGLNLNKPPAVLVIFNPGEMEEQNNETQETADL